MSGAHQDLHPRERVLLHAGLAGGHGSRGRPGQASAAAQVSLAGAHVVCGDCWAPPGRFVWEVQLYSSASGYHRDCCHLCLAASQVIWDESVINEVIELFVIILVTCYFKEASNHY